MAFGSFFWVEVSWVCCDLKTRGGLCWGVVCLHSRVGGVPCEDED